jgi:serine/threonine protein phosphatase 1
MDPGRTFVFGDIHGCVDEVSRLLDAIAPDDADTVCFLGDYVDRGPSSKGVIDRMLQLRGEGPRCQFLRGNHEDMFLAYIGESGHHGDAFLWNGGRTTLESYGLTGYAGAEAASRLPEEHLEFLRALEMRFIAGDFLCVHAGVRPTRALDDQDDEDLMWIREEFITAKHPFPHTILYGHTPQREIRLDLPYKLGLDTGLVYGSQLSCLELRDKQLYQISRNATEVRQQSLADEFEAAKPA